MQHPLPPAASDDARALARALGSSVTAAAILLRRGLPERALATRYLDPRLAHLTPPGAMRDRDAASARIARAVRAKERVCIFGDYDADGVTSAAILTGVLQTLGGEVVTLLADRFHGGYGLSQEALGRVLATGATLVITCDVGSSDHERLDEARRLGVDVVVIDHHRVPEETLPAFAFLNPHRPDCPFPYKGLASCGLALSVAAGVRAELATNLDVRPWLDLVALGTVADVAPLDGDNRALVRAGLAALAAGGRPGVRALAEIAGHPGSEPLTGEDIAYRLAPRVNAPGRLRAPDLALALLLATNPIEARALASEVEQICVERKAIDRAMAQEALAMIAADEALSRAPALVLAKEGWHQGVVGIVAGRLASRLGKPVIVIALDGASGRGSVRGPAGFPLYDALARCKDALLSFGGHQAAAGVHVAADRLESLRDRFSEACAALGAQHDATAAPLLADARLDEGDSPEVVLRDVARFEPCGHKNPAPLLALADARVRTAREVTGGHLQVELTTASGSLRGFGFELGHLAPRLGKGVKATVLGKLRRDTWRGNGAAELRVEAIVGMTDPD